MADNLQTSPDFELIPYKGSQADILTYLNLQSQIEGELISITTDPLVARRELADKVAHFVMSERKIAGFVAHHKSDEQGGCGYLFELVLLKQFRGQGIGSRVLQTVIETYASNQPVVLRVRTKNTEAVTFYENRGFKILCCEPDPSLVGHFDYVMRYS